MEIEILELSDSRAKFVIKDSETAIVNGLRRSMLAEVPTMAVDHVNIYDNTSVLFDEQIAMRMGLIPIKTDLDSYVSQEECDCNGAGCSQCQVSLKLSAEGPRTVYSGDLVPTDPMVKVADDKIPIIELKERQKLVLEAVVKMGIGRKHAKWQAGVACGYKHSPIISILENCDSCGKCTEECPKEILLIEDEKLIITDPFECILCNLCERACEINAIKIDEDRNSFIFVMESDGSHPARDLVVLGADIIINKAKHIDEILAAIE